MMRDTNRQLEDSIGPAVPVCIASGRSPGTQGQLISILSPTLARSLTSSRSDITRNIFIVHSNRSHHATNRRIVFPANYMQTGQQGQRKAAKEGRLIRQHLGVNKGRISEKNRERIFLPFLRISSLFLSHDASVFCAISSRRPANRLNIFITSLSWFDVTR